MFIDPADASVAVDVATGTTKAEKDLEFWFIVKFNPLIAMIVPLSWFAWVIP